MTCAATSPRSWAKHKSCAASVCRGQLAPLLPADPLAIQGREDFRAGIHLQAQLVSPVVGTRRLRRSQAFRSRKDVAQPELKIELKFAALGSVRHAAEQVKPTPELRHGLYHRRARSRLLPGFEPVPTALSTIPASLK